jgi:hypothetical protein
MPKQLNTRGQHVKVRAYKTLWEERIESEEMPGLAVTIRMQEQVGQSGTTKHQGGKRRKP